jgi:hypothetical protein
MKKYILVAALSAIVSVFIYAHAAPQKSSPGSQPFTPTRIDWLTTTLQANLRKDITGQKPYSLDIVPTDSETIVISVRYVPGVDGSVMKNDIDTARKQIQVTVKRYGWDDWVRIKEDVQSVPLPK